MTPAKWTQAWGLVFLLFWVVMASVPLLGIEDAFRWIFLAYLAYCLFFSIFLYIQLLRKTKIDERQDVVYQARAVLGAIVVGVLMFVMIYPAGVVFVDSRKETSDVAAP
jgi:hypothetical protein